MGVWIESSDDWVIERPRRTATRDSATCLCGCHKAKANAWSLRSPRVAVLPRLGRDDSGEGIGELAIRELRV